MEGFEPNPMQRAGLFVQRVFVALRLAFLLAVTALIYSMLR